MWLYQEVSSCIKWDTNWSLLFNSCWKIQMSKIWRKNRRGELENISLICQFAMFPSWCSMLSHFSYCCHLFRETDTPRDSPWCPSHQEMKLMIIKIKYSTALLTPFLFPLCVSHLPCSHITLIRPKDFDVPLCLFVLICILLFSCSKVSFLSLTLPFIHCTLLLLHYISLIRSFF